MLFLFVAISRSGCCYPLGIAAAVVCQGGCRLTAFEPFKRRIFAVILYWTVSQHLPLNPIIVLCYILSICTVIKTESRIFPNHISYSAESSTYDCCSSSSFVEPGTFEEGQTPERGIPPSYRVTRWYTKVHLGFCLRFSTLIGQIGRVPLFGAGPRRYIRSRLFRLAVTAFWRALTASWRQEGKRKQIFPRAIRTTEPPSNPSPLTFRINQIQILQTSSTHATMAANVSQQDTNTHGTG